MRSTFTYLLYFVNGIYEHKILKATASPQKCHLSSVCVSGTALESMSCKTMVSLCFYVAGVTWQPYQYYADDCLETFGMSPKRVSELAPSNLTRVICTEQYSRWVGAKVSIWSPQGFFWKPVTFLCFPKCFFF